MEYHGCGPPYTEELEWQFGCTVEKKSTSSENTVITDCFCAVHHWRNEDGTCTLKSKSGLYT